MLNSPSPRSLDWHFPLNRPHTGVPLGNGLQGILVWGGETLFITVARAGFWDHRNGCTIPTETTFAQVRQCLEAQDETGIRQLFSLKKRESGTAPCPQQMGGGRLTLNFPDGLRPIAARLNLELAEIEVTLATHEEAEESFHLHIRQDAYAEVCWIDLPPALASRIGIRLEAAYDLIHQEAMRQIGIAAPSHWTEDQSGGFIQTLPADEPLALAWQREGDCVRLVTALGTKAAENIRHTLTAFNPVTAETTTTAWWRDYWAKVPHLNLPDATLQELYTYGLYRQAGLIRRDTPAATLQGPWMEDTRIPPWSNDYHFNINVQLVYGAALATGQHEEMAPLWAMLKSWLPQLREMGRNFYGIEGAMILPHAVDDRCQLMGTFWAGAIDQACLAWMGQMAYQYYQYTLDLDHLRELAFPLLEGAFLGYFAMLEKVTNPDGTWRYSLPVSVSPEFGGSDMKKCWGRDASFQLAALHSTLHLLGQAAVVLGQNPDPRWCEIAEHLPPYTTVPAKDGSYGWISTAPQRIALWQEKDLPESHRHHSHLAAIYPFRTIDPFAPEHQKTVAFSLNRWNTLGPGNWTGWCVPWASALCSRCGLPDAALSWLHLLARNFCNEGRATLHNADGAGVFGWDDGSLAWPNHRKGADFIYYEVMQMDAAMGAINAVLEMLLQTRGDTIHLADRLPKGWRELSFSGLRTEGAFVIEGSFRHGRVASVGVKSLAGRPLRLSHGIIGHWTMDGTVGQGATLELSATEIGHTYILCAQPSI